MWSKNKAHGYLESNPKVQTVHDVEGAVQLKNLPILTANKNTPLWCIHTHDLLGVNYCMYNSHNYGLHCSVWGHSHQGFSQLLCET